MLFVNGFYLFLINLSSPVGIYLLELLECLYGLVISISLMHVTVISKESMVAGNVDFVWKLSSWLKYKIILSDSSYICLKLQANVWLQYIEVIQKNPFFRKCGCQFQDFKIRASPTELRWPPLVIKMVITLCGRRRNPFT